MHPLLTTGVLNSSVDRINVDGIKASDELPLVLMLVLEERAISQNRL